MKKILYSILFSTFLFGCSLIPKIEKNKIVELESIHKTEATQQNLTFVQNEWWKKTFDPTFEQLVNIILLGNSDLKIAKYNIEKANEAITLVGAQTGLSIDAAGEVQRRKLPIPSNVIIPPPFNNSVHLKDIINIGSLGLKANYDIDLFDRVGALVKESKYKAEAVQLSENLIKLNISTEVGKLYQYWKYLKAQEIILNTEKSVLQELVMMENKKVEIGKGIMDEYLNRENQLREIEALIEKNLAAKEVTLNTIFALAGDKNKDTIKKLLADATPHNFLNITIPEAVDSQVIAQRPDIAADLLLIKASEKHLESAKAGFYPHISITGQYGYSALGIHNLFNKHSLGGFLGANIYLPIFHMGAVRSNYKIAGIDLNIVIEQYNKAVINAYSSIDNELYKTKAERKILKIADENFENNKISFNNMTKRLEIGTISKYDYLQANLKWLNAELNNVSQHFNYATQQLNFINSIGGVYVGGNNDR